MAPVAGTSSVQVGLRLAAILLLGLRCTPLSDFDVHQCDVHADCDVIDDGVGRCEASRCMAGCADNAHCESVDPRSPVCEAEGGDCVGLSSQRGECYASAGYNPLTMRGMTLSEMLVIGVLAPTVRSAGWLSVQLAVDEINSLGGLPGGSSARPVLAVLCDSSTTERLQAGVDYLVEELHVNTILAPVDDAALRAVVSQPSTKGRALFLSPNGSDPWNGAAPDTARPLFLGAEYGDVVPMYGSVLGSAVSSVIARGKSANMLRVAIVVSDTDEDRHLAAAVRTETVIADKTFDQLELEYQVATFSLQGDAWPVDAIVGYVPDLILVFAGGSSLSSPYRSRATVVAALEARAAGSAWQPAYVISPRTGRDVELSRLARESDSFRARAVTLSADRLPDDAASSGLGARFASAFPVAFQPDVVRGPTLEMYAGVYYLAYAAAASPERDTTAAGVLVGMNRITDVNAERVDIGPVGASRAIELLERGATFNLLGASGEAAFDATTGARSGAPHALCWLEDGSLVRARNVDGFATELDLVPMDCAQAIFDAVAE